MRIIEKIKRFLLKVFQRFHFMPSKLYLGLLFRFLVKSNLNLNNPVTFNEKIQWLKLYGFKPEYTQIVDKYRVRDYLIEKLSPHFENPHQFLAPLLGVWERFDDIDFNLLPNQFVLKTNHDSGGVVICYNKLSFDIKATKKKIDKSLKRNYYWLWREPCYKGIKPVIIAEELLCQNVKNETPVPPTDYKIHCSNGVPQFIQVIGDRDFKNHTGKVAFYSLDWKRIEAVFYSYPEYECDIPAPNNLELMLKIASVLSEGIVYCRIDLYEVSGQVKFGEITFYPSGGMYKYPHGKEKINLELGKMIEIDTFNAN